MTQLQTATWLSVDIGSESVWKNIGKSLSCVIIRERVNQRAKDFIIFLCVCSVFLEIEPTANELRNSVLRYCEFAKSIFVRRPRLSYKSNIWY